MKNIEILILTMLLAFGVSCNSPEAKSSDHSHEGESVAAHSHEEEVLADHTHEEDPQAAHNHEAESAAAHTHEEDPQATHNHEDDAESTQLHESDQVSETNADFPYKSLKLSLQSFNFVKKTSGSILPDRKSEVSIISKSPGIVHFDNNLLYQGLWVEGGDQLFYLRGENLTEDNTDLSFAIVEADFRKAEEDYKRASALIEDKLITREHFLEKKNIYEKAKAEYLVYKSMAEGDFSAITVPLSGYINEIFVKEGDKVKAGDQLATILTRNSMVLKADISPSDFGIIDRIASAKFATGYSSSVYNTLDMNGLKISHGRSTDQSSFYIPIFFRIDYNEELIPGTYADVWLIGDEIKDAIVIPNSAILEEFGKFYVYIDHGDHFDKRYISPGTSDGERTLILSGLKENETIVSEGVYQVKMSMITSIPNTHDHSH